MAQEPYTNRLSREKSPYLLQHAHNPVDWYPWGEEAFLAAKSQDKPIFLSIGYATCHWCHVMERESFEDPALAKILNDVFINIKVDREELPQVDSLYMEFAQALMSTAGGWPLNLILTPDLKPFFAITYLPPHARQGLIGLDQFALQIKQLWQGEEKALLVEQAEHLIETFVHTVRTAGEEMPHEMQLQAAAEILFDLADPVHGGIGGAPKFPLGYQLEFLLQIAKEKGDSRALFYVELTLAEMHRGGIYDHLGGGFARYSIDEKWMIPHFEKMAYDNAILARAYLTAWKFLKKPIYRQVAEETLNYMLREMQDKDGGFYSGQDADTEGQEGLYYTWTWNEVQQILGPSEAPLFCAFYGLQEMGNYEGGRNVLHVPLSIDEFSQANKISVQEVEKRLSLAREKLLKAREKRPAPFRDEKILSGWNGLMIDVLARAGSAFENPLFTQAALKAAAFVRDHLFFENGLFRRFCAGEAKFPAVLEDYAFLIKGVLALFEEGLGAEWLQWAIELAEITKSKFKANKGAFFHAEEALVVRKCDYYDGAEPSGNGVHCENLLRLYQLTHEEIYLNQAEDILKAAKNHIETYPPGSCYHLMALARYYDLKAPTLVIALNKERSLEKEIRSWISTHFSPHLEMIWKTDEKIDEVLPEEKGKTPIDGKTALYLCRQNVCEPALMTKEGIEKAILAL